jgi:3-deoxy-7-phosphoheptulonate synthase
MILVLRRSCNDAEVQSVVDRLGEMGMRGCVMKSADRTLVSVSGDCDHDDLMAFNAEPLVELIVPTVAHHQQVVPSPAHARREICLGPRDAVIGGPRLGIIAGPCSVEDKQQLMEVAHAVKQAGAIGLRGGAFKPRTNPYSFQGLGEKALQHLAEARDATGLAVVTEVMSVDQVEVVAQYADVLQIGTRSMHNFSLLSAVGRTGKTILLKRGWSATLGEFLHAAEYIINEGNANVVLCERGIRTFETYVRNTLALAVVPAVKKRSPLPIIVDPSHGTGVADLVAPLSRAAIACGADGLLIEVHPEPPRALTDSAQAIDIPQFQDLMADARRIAEAVGRSI